MLCMEACGSMDLANNALARATEVFVKVWNAYFAATLIFNPHNNTHIER